MEHEKDNTGLIIVITVVVILLIGIIAYFALSNKNTKDVIDDTKNTIENIDDTKTAMDVKGTYQAILSPNTNTTTAEEADDTTNNYIELSLENNDEAKLVVTTESTNVMIGKYTVTDKNVTLITNGKTYEFTINNDSLEYNNTTLTKVDSDTLKYIK